MAENLAKFGAAGNSESFAAVSKSSLDAPGWLDEVMGVDAYEYQCGNGVRISTETAKKLGENAREHGILLSLHSPYYISLTNLANMDKNIGYVLQSCAAAKAMGADRIVIHSGSTTGRAREEALADAKTTLLECIKAADAEGYGDIALCPETMGKINQLGDFDEVMELCKLDERLLPCVDFGHLYARTKGELEGYDAMAALLDRMAGAIGRARTENFHSHFSQIEYSSGGEKRHLVFGNGSFGPDFRPLAKVIAERGLHPRFICESAGTQAEDAAAMKKVYLEELERVK